VFINYTHSSSDTQHHGKAINLDVDDQRAPFPAIFLIHELRVRGFRPFDQEPDDIPTTSQFQDWMIMDDSITSETASTANTGNQGSAGVAPESSSGGPAPGMMSLPPLNDETIQDILTASRESVSWKACILEGASWDGTAEENTEKYRKLAEL